VREPFSNHCVQILGTSRFPAGEIDSATHMFPQTILEPQDDPQFLAVVDRLIAGLAQRDRPEEIRTIVIDNWFDHKWLRYSGYGIVALHGNPWMPVAKEEHRQDQLTFPPFPPNRVVAEYFFARGSNGEYDEQAAVHLVHARHRQRSSRNIHRRVAAFCKSGLFVWYSSGSAANQKGSAMVYSVDKGVTAAWYAAWSVRSGWQLDRVKGVDRHIVTTLMGGEH
jgi:hypothetical protein